MTVRTLLKKGHEILTFAEVETPLLDSLLLLARAMDIRREKLMASLPDEVPDGAEERFRASLDRRCAGAPVAYILGSREFYGLDFMVDERVLVPRPDTEAAVDKVLAVIRGDPALRRVHDSCTGSGCIAVALKSTLPDLEVSASDVSPGALAVAEANAARLVSGGVRFTASDLLDGVPGPFDVIVSNPPYLRDREIEDRRKLTQAEPEPELALAGGGADGTGLAARLIRSAPSRLVPGGWLVLEADPAQMNKLYAYMDQAGFHSIDVEKDLAGRNRVIAGRLDPVPRQAPAEPWHGHSHG